MHELDGTLVPGDRDRVAGGRRCDPSPLECRDDGPADLEDLLSVPLALPVADPAHTGARCLVDDLELPRARPFVVGLAFGDLLGALRPAEVHHHRRVGEALQEQVEVILPPGLDVDSDALHEPVLGSQNRVRRCTRLLWTEREIHVARASAHAPELLPADYTTAFCRAAVRNHSALSLGVRSSVSQST